MEQHIASLTDDTTKVNDALPKSRGSPARKPKAPKAEPPAFTLDENISQPAPSNVPVEDEKSTEPLLMENPHRFVLFPIEHPDVMAMAKKAIAVFWTAEELDLTKDMKDWEKLDANTQHFIKHVLGFFAASDGILMENLALNFQHEVQWPEAKYFYANQNFM